MTRMVAELLQQSIQFLDAGGKGLTKQESHGDTIPAQRTSTHLNVPLRTPTHLSARLPARIPTPNPLNQRLETTRGRRLLFPL